MTEPELTDAQAVEIVRRIAEGLPGWELPIDLPSPICPVV